MKKNTKWKPGQSGNPKGKPKGAIDRRTRWRDALDTELPTIMRKLVAAAKAGDVQAASLILSRCCPPLRPQREVQAIPVLAEAATLSDRARVILDAVAAGDLSPDAAGDLLAAVAAAAKVIETDELAARVAALEARHD